MARHRLAAACTLLSLLFPATTTTAQSADWAGYNGNYQGTRFSALTQITPANASRLQRVCAFDSREMMSQQSGPLVINGVLYFTTDTSTYAIDARTCALKWKHHRAYTPLGFLKNNHGVAHLD